MPAAQAPRQRFFCAWFSTSVHQVKQAVPARQAEEMQSGVNKRGDAVPNRLGLVTGLLGNVKRPEDKQGPADDVLFGNKTPVAAVEAVIAVVAHGEVMVWRNDHIAILDAGLQDRYPLRSNAAVSAKIFGKVVSIWIGEPCMPGIRLVLRHAV